MLLCVHGKSQLRFRTVVPAQPVIQGESFQVQYILEGAERSASIRPPSFNNFRFVTGPNVYSGVILGDEGQISSRNEAFTLEAIKPGKFTIQGATATIGTKVLRSNDVTVTVISKAEALLLQERNILSSSVYFLRPGEDPYKKIKQNLFIKVMVDKNKCIPGEPVLATFKLYSRLESKSDIVKNPGFYGFTVYDMVNLSDKQVSTETINGRLFDVHTIRKVQLYPLQAGVYTIDPMEVKTKVEFSRTAVNKKTEQEVVEGVLNSKGDDKPPAGAEFFETAISTEPVTIHVKPVPEKNKPASYDGATGSFTITATVSRDSIAKNEQGFLDIVIEGKGNFIQLSAPMVKWPAGVEGFDPAVFDELDKTKLPLAGKRRFRYAFVSAAERIIELEPVSFSFFNTDSNSYQSVTTPKVKVVVAGEKKANAPGESNKTSIAETSERAARMAGIIVGVLVVLILVYWAFMKKETAPAPAVVPVIPPESAEKLLASARAVIPGEDNSFYAELNSALWRFAADKFKLTGSELNKQTLEAKMDSLGVSSDLKKEWLDLLIHSEAGLYTTAYLQSDREALLITAESLMTRIQEA